MLERDLGRAAAAHLSALASGRDDRRVERSVQEKSIGAEETFAEDIGDPELIRRELLRLSGRTAQGLRAGGNAARTVVVKLRRADFTTITRSRTLPEPTDVAQRIYATACSLYEGAGLSAGTRLRLVGVRVTGLVPAADGRDPAGPGGAAGVLAGRRAGAGPDHQPVRVRGGPPGHAGGPADAIEAGQARWRGE